VGAPAVGIRPRLPLSMSPVLRGAMEVADAPSAMGRFTGSRFAPEATIYAAPGSPYTFRASYLPGAVPARGDSLKAKCRFRGKNPLQRDVLRVSGVGGLSASSREIPHAATPRSRGQPTRADRGRISKLNSDCSRRSHLSGKKTLVGPLTCYLSPGKEGGTSVSAGQTPRTCPTARWDRDRSRSPQPSHESCPTFMVGQSLPPGRRPEASRRRRRGPSCLRSERSPGASPHCRAAIDRPSPVRQGLSSDRAAQSLRRLS
jgi:hypothetical protein